MKFFPKYIRLGGHVVKVTRKKDLVSEHDAFGTWDDGNLEITIDADISNSLAWETFWHEVVEAINTSIESNLDHSVIQTTGFLLHQVFNSILEKQQYGEKGDE